MEEYNILLSDAELKEFWAGYELWLDIVELSLPLPLPEGEVYDLEPSK